MHRATIISSLWWNLLLIVVGTALYAVGVKALAVPHQFIPGGLFGVGSLIYYLTGWLSPGWLYGLLNVPVFAFAWTKVSRRFCLYSLFAMVLTSLFYEIFTIDIVLKNQLYAAIAAGLICGAGGGIVLRSLGSCGGLDVLAVWLNQKYNIGVGRTYFGFNLLLFLTSAAYLPADQIVASLILVFLCSATVDYVLSMFSQRKMVMIISNQHEEIAKGIMGELKLGVTRLKGEGAYTGTPRDVLLTVVNNIQLKRLEEIVFTRDDNALFIVDNTFSVIGSTFSRRKLY